VFDGHSDHSDGRHRLHRQPRRVQPVDAARRLYLADSRGAWTEDRADAVRLRQTPIALGGRCRRRRRPRDAAFGASVCTPGLVGQRLSKIRGRPRSRLEPLLTLLYFYCYYIVQWKHRPSFFSSCPQLPWQTSGTIFFISLHIGWRRGSLVRTSVFGWRAFPDLRLIYG